MSRSKNRKIADLISGGTFDDGVVAASEVTGLHSVASTGNFNELSNKPAPFDPATLASVAVSGSFNDLSDQPAPFDPNTLSTVAVSGSFNDLSNQPAPFDPSTLATVATTGAYSSLSGKPSLGTASTQATGAFATAAQGTKADAAVQPNTNPTFGTVSASSLTGIGSIDATTAAAIGAAGIGGKLLQVVHAQTMGTFGGGGSSFQSTANSLSITPSASNSKILVSMQGGDCYAAYGGTGGLAIFRGGTKLNGNTADIGGQFFTPEYVYGKVRAPVSMQYLDSPNTTSSVTYTLRIKSFGGTVYLMSGNTSSMNIVLMEIGA